MRQPPYGMDVFLECMKRANGWVIKNLNRYGNSVLPSELITGESDIRIGEKLLSVITNEHVTIRNTDDGYICYR